MITNKEIQILKGVPNEFWLPFAKIAKRWANDDVEYHENLNYLVSTLGDAVAEFENTIALGRSNS